MGKEEVARTGEGRCIIAQYAGRLHRDFEGKESVIIYDYVDVHVKMLERMYQKRLSAYASMGYTIFSSTGDGSANVIYTVRATRRGILGFLGTVFVTMRSPRRTPRCHLVFPI